MKRIIIVLIIITLMIAFGRFNVFAMEKAEPDPHTTELSIPL